jgi:hypothetical protein
MPAASASQARPGTRGRVPTNSSGTPRGVRTRRAGGAAHVRWDRLGRVAMLCVLGALLYLYLSAGVHMLSSWRQSSHDSATVGSLEREHRALLRAHDTLSGQSTLESEDGGRRAALRRERPAEELSRPAGARASSPAARARC